VLLALTLIINLMLFASGRLEVLHFWAVVLAVLLLTRLLRVLPG